MRPPRPQEETASQQLAAHVDGAALGLLGGGFAGLVLALLLLAFRVSDTALPVCIFGGAFVGAVIGFMRAEAGMDLAEGAGHFGVGLVSGLSGQWLRPVFKGVKWLNGVLVFGVLCGFALLAFLRWR